ncbi:MAG: TolC family protein [Geobacter sp.]|nr:TolC family protein [Geobacter sp.]
MKTMARAIFLLAAIPSLASAEGARISLREAVNLALERSHMVKAAFHEQKAGEHAHSASRSRYFPSLYLEETFSASNSPTRVFMMKLDEGRFSQNDFLISNLNNPATHTDFRTSVSIEQPLFDPVIAKGAAVAEKEQEARGLAYERQREDVAFLVFSDYLEVQKAKAFQAIADQAVEDALEQLRLAKTRSEKGVGLKADELRARTYLSETEQRRITAENDVTVARMRLALATGGEAGVELDTAEDVTAGHISGDAKTLVGMSSAKRLDLKELEARREQAESVVAQATANFWPKIYAGAAYQMNDKDTPFGRENDAWQAGATFKWELFDGMRRWNDRQRANAELRAVSERLEQYRKEVTFQVSEALLRRAEAGKRLEVARHAFLDAEEGMRLTAARFKNSLALMVEMLDAQTALKNARANLVQSESDYALATARVWHAAGILLEEVLK